MHIHPTADLQPRMLPTSCRMVGSMSSAGQVTTAAGMQGKRVRPLQILQQVLDSDAAEVEKHRGKIGDFEGSGRHAKRKHSAADGSATLQGKTYLGNFWLNMFYEIDFSKTLDKSSRCTWEGQTGIMMPLTILPVAGVVSVTLLSQRKLAKITEMPVAGEGVDKNLLNALHPIPVLPLQVLDALNLTHPLLKRSLLPNLPVASTTYVMCDLCSHFFWCLDHYAPFVPKSRESSARLQNCFLQ